MWPDINAVVKACADYQSHVTLVGLMTLRNLCRGVGNKKNALDDIFGAADYRVGLKALGFCFSAGEL